MLAKTAGAPSGIVLAGGSLYWIDYGHHNLQKDALTGGAPQVFAFTTGKGPGAIAAASDRVVVAALDPSNSGEIQQYTFDLNAGPSVGPFINPFDVAVEQASIYWTESSTGGIWSGTVGLPLKKELYTGELDCESIAADGAGVYWARPHPIGIVRASFGGGAPVSLAARSSRSRWPPTRRASTG